MKRNKGRIIQLRQGVAVFNQHRQALLTGLLVSALVLLLFGICSHLPVPPLTVSSGTAASTTAVDYSAFLAQVRSGNALAVSIQDQTMQGIVSRPLPGGQTALPFPLRMTRQQALAALSAIIAPTSDSAASALPSLDAAHLISTNIPDGGDAGLIPLLVSRHVAIRTLPSGQLPQWIPLLWRSLLLLLFLLLLMGLLLSVTRRRAPGTAGERLAQLRRSPAHLFQQTRQENGHGPSASGKLAHVGSASSPPAVPEPPPVTFADVAGIDEVRQELEELVQFLRTPERFERLGARIPRGALLVGPPGTGKTLLARAVAGEAGVPFYSVSASEFVEIYVGLGARRVRDLFRQAREHVPCVIFIDELDAVGRKRSNRSIGNGEREHTLNQLLVELDGFTDRQAIVVLAATNRADVLDQALLRPGRFDRHITVALPDRAGREAILRVHTRKMPLHEEVSLERLAGLTTGMSGADLANLVNEAALLAARRDLAVIPWPCFEEALARVQLGAQRPLVLSETERRITAYHEGGHALVAHYLPGADPVNWITILPRGATLGVTQFVAGEDRYNYNRETLMARLAVGLGGRVAEELVFGAERVTTGAENDFQAATRLAWNMVTRWGMSEQVGVVFVEGRGAPPAAGLAFNSRQYQQEDAFSTRCLTLTLNADGLPMVDESDRPDGQNRFVPAVAPAGTTGGSPSMSTLVDLEVGRLLREAYQIARDVLNEHRVQLDLLAQALMEREQLDRTAFERFVAE